jgi:hypothetical protein
MRAVCVFHYHLRPSGVRSVVERTLPALLKQVLQTDRVFFLTGEVPDADWAAHITMLLAPRKVSFEVVPEMAYLSELGSPSPGFRKNLSEAVNRLFLRHRPKLVWAHNLSIARNPLAAATLDAQCKAHGSVLFCHHHDWWPEVRWERYAEMQAWGLATSSEVADATCPEGAHVRHAVVHPRDAAVVGTHVGLRSMWLPNLSPAAHFRPTQQELEHGRAILAGMKPYWLMPTRLLGRKNPLECILVAKLLGATHFATLGGVSSPREAVYENLLEKAAAALGMDLSINLAKTTGLRPAVLLAQAQAGIQCSLLEGWGLAGVEAAALQKPFVLRELPGMEHVTTPFTYKELVLATPTSSPEQLRRTQASSRAAAFLPAWWQDIFRNAHTESETPWFSHLSPLGQLEYLVESQSENHAGLLSANPWLQAWRDQLAAPLETTGAVKDGPMDEEEIWLNRFQQLVEARGPKGNSEDLLSDVFSRSLASAKVWPWLVNTEGLDSELAPLADVPAAGQSSAPPAVSAISEPPAAEPAPLPELIAIPLPSAEAAAPLSSVFADPAALHALTPLPTPEVKDELELVRLAEDEAVLVDAPSRVYVAAEYYQAEVDESGEFSEPDEES